LAYWLALLVAPNRYRRVFSHHIVLVLLATLLVACGGSGGASSTFTLGGKVSGLSSGNSVTIESNGNDSVSLSANSAFAFPTAIAAGSSYAVTVTKQPTGQQCTVMSGSGTIQSSNITNIQINCVALTYTLGGAVTGLSPGNAVALQNNGGDTLTVSSNAPFVFTTAVAYGASYSVSASGQPNNQLCTVSAGSGVVAAANITNVQVSCVVKTYSIGGTVTGLQPGRSLVLLDNAGDAITVTSVGAFTFATGLIKGSPYNVTIGTQPTDQNCFLNTGGSGTVATSNVTSVLVQCPFLQTLHNFGVTANDGYSPETGVVLGGDGNLYGTTTSGGANLISSGNVYGAGIFFKLSPSGVETVTWDFGLGQDGQDPSGALLTDMSGNFYGTTTIGGLYGGGTVFRITPAGQETVLWNFGSGTDGLQPFGAMTFGQDGSLYGTTTKGGTNGSGTVFKLTLAGVETVLWNFGATTDGQTPEGPLIQASDGNFYGTTENGGAFGFGSVYRLTPAGAEAVLYSFADGLDGQGPQGLIEGVDGDLYGITIGGGAYNVGTAFEVTKGGVETVLWTFGNGIDGRNPVAAPLMGLDGNLYGVTNNGGTNSRGSIYRLTPSGSETLLWSFKGTDGEGPFSGISQGPDGAIYGTTMEGGVTGGNGNGGTVFKLTM
jgi:uncharacterized repeat protein (TIGR03803 family)